MPNNPGGGEKEEPNPAEILKTRCVMTVINGEIVYEAR